MATLEESCKKELPEKSKFEAEGLRGKQEQLKKKKRGRVLGFVGSPAHAPSPVPGHSADWKARSYQML